MTDKKSIKIGSVLKIEKEDKNGNVVTKRTIKLGQEKSKDSKYDYTVLIKVLDHEGNEVAKVKNPWVNLNAPHKNAPETIDKELVIWIDSE